MTPCAGLKVEKTWIADQLKTFDEVKVKLKYMIIWPSLSVHNIDEILLYDTSRSPSVLLRPLLKLKKEMINYDNEKGTGADSGLVFAEMAKEARNVSKTVCPNLMISFYPNSDLKRDFKWKKINRPVDFKVKLFEISIQQDTRVNL